MLQGILALLVRRNEALVRSVHGEVQATENELLHLLKTNGIEMRYKEGLSSEEMDVSLARGIRMFGGLTGAEVVVPFIYELGDDELSNVHEFRKATNPKMRLSPLTISKYHSRMLSDVVGIGVEVTSLQNGSQAELRIKFPVAQADAMLNGAERVMILPVMIDGAFMPAGGPRGTPASSVLNTKPTTIGLVSGLCLVVGKGLSYARVCDD